MCIHNYVTTTANKWVSLQARSTSKLRTSYIILYVRTYQLILSFACMNVCSYVLLFLQCILRYVYTVPND